MTPKKRKSRFVVLEDATAATYYDTLDDATSDSEDGCTILEVVKVWEVEAREPEAVEGDLDDLP